MSTHQVMNEEPRLRKDGGRRSSYREEYVIYYLSSVDGHVACAVKRAPENSRTMLAGKLVLIQNIKTKEHGCMMVVLITFR